MMKGALKGCGLSAIELLIQECFIMKISTLKCVDSYFLNPP